MSADLSQVLTSIEACSLIEPSQRRLFEESARAAVDPTVAIREWVKRGLLTPYQANLVNQKKTAELVVGPYVLLDRIGRGGMGDVFKARHRHLRTRTAALKVIRPELLKNPASRQFLARFEREPQTLASLSHPNIVQVFDAGRSGETLYLAMEHLQGEPLDQRAKDKPLSVQQACDVVRQTAEGLRYLHHRGMVHRDIKPANLFLTTDGTVKILDLGLVLIKHSAGTDETLDPLTMHTGGLGTPAFWAPEQAIHPHGVDIRADIYSLGRTFYYLLTGQMPSPEPRPIAAEKLSQLRPDVPAAVAALIARMTAWDPADRPHSPDEVIAALVKTKHRTLFASQPKWFLPAVIGGGVAAMLLCVVLLTLLFRSKPAGDAFAKGHEPPIVPGLEKKNDLPFVPVAVVPNVDPPKVNPPVPKDPSPVVKKVEPMPEPNVDPVPPPKVAAEPPGEFGESRVLTNHTREVVGVAFLWDGMALSCSSDDTLLIDLKSDTVLKKRTSTDILQEMMAPPKLPEFPGDFKPQFPPAGFDQSSAEAKLAERSPLGAVLPLPNGKDAIIAGMSHLTVWNVETWKKKKAFTRPHCGVIGAWISVSGDGRYATHANWDNLVKMYDLTKLEEMPRSFPGSRAVLSRDGKRILVGHSLSMRLTLYETAKGQPIKSFGAYQQGVHAVAITPDGKFGLSAPMREKDAILWDLTTFEEVRRFKGHAKPVTSAVFSPDGTRLITGSEDTTARLWNVADATEIDRFESHERAVNAVAISPGGTYALTAGADQRMGIWQLKK
ncbi:MAG: serine/threonine-protein kinase [Gemmataceae bacterium]